MPRGVPDQEPRGDDNYVDADDGGIEGEPTMAGEVVEGMETGAENEAAGIARHSANAPGAEDEQSQENNSVERQREFQMPYEPKCTDDTSLHQRTLILQFALQIASPPHLFKKGVEDEPEQQVAELRMTVKADAERDDHRKHRLDDRSASNGTHEFTFHQVYSCQSAEAGANTLSPTPEHVGEIDIGRYRTEMNGHGPT